MQDVLADIVKHALEVRAGEFVRIVEETTDMLRDEDTEAGRYRVLGKLVKLPASGEALVIGDLHGDLESLVDILKGSSFLGKMKQNPEAMLVFLGDYGDRGLHSAEVYYTVLKLKLLFPAQTILMRGNHEGPEDLMASPHDLPEKFELRFGEEWRRPYAKVRGLFEHLYVAVLVENRSLMVHGGLPQETNSATDIAYAHVMHPKHRLLEDLLWSDPEEMTEEACPSPRGAGRLFNQKVTTKVLKKVGAKILIRGHQQCEEGFKVNHNGKVLTIFSCKGSPYFDAHGAYLDLDLSKDTENVEHLIPSIHKF